MPGSPGPRARGCQTQRHRARPYASRRTDGRPTGHTQPVEQAVDPGRPTHTEEVEIGLGLFHRLIAGWAVLLLEFAQPFEHGTAVGGCLGGLLEDDLENLR